MMANETGIKNEREKLTGGSVVSFCENHHVLM